MQGVDLFNGVLQQITQAALQKHQLITWCIDVAHPTIPLSDYERAVFRFDGFLVKNVSDRAGCELKEYSKIV